MSSSAADARAALAAWHEEPATGHESRYTPWASPGWHSWNAMSPEVEVCDFVAALTEVMRPRTLIETGTGQGYMTRRIACRLDDTQRLLCYESSPEWRKALRTLDFFDGDRRVLSPDESPDDRAMAAAGLCFFDSDFSYRIQEIERWWRLGRPGSVAVIHDTGHDHDPGAPHTLVRGMIVELGVPGFFLDNPRGAFVGVKPAGADGHGQNVGAGAELARRLASAEAEVRALRATKTFRYTANARRLYSRLRGLRAGAAAQRR